MPVADSPHPLIPMRFHKRIIIQMRISTIHAVNLFHLPAAERLMLIETPQTLQQALATEDLMQAGDAAVEGVGGVEEGGVAVGDFDAEAKEFARGFGVAALL